MTLAETALAFAREILGWEDAYHANVAIMRRGDTHRLAREEFRFTDLNAVMEAVKAWQDATALETRRFFTTTLGYSLGIYTGHVFIDHDVLTAKTDDPCEALMLVCLAASRKLKEGG